MRFLGGLVQGGSGDSVEEAEKYFRLAVAQDPSNVRNLGRYAVFLEHICGDSNAAEEYYKLAIEV